MIQVASPAPEFELDGVMPDGSIKKIKLSDYRGKWVVFFFYPLDFTFVCPTEITSFSECHDTLRLSALRCWEPALTPFTPTWLG
jgi:alkyl hydroperoxide reductase subunit AhpC